MTFDVISTGSKGNAVLIEDEVLIDCGVPFKLLSPYIKAIRLVLLTHEHGDHFIASSAHRLHTDRPTLRFGCCEWMVGHLLAAGVDKRVIDVYEPHKEYRYGAGLTIRPEPLFHNVPNCGYHIHRNGESLFYATDTGTLDGVTAKGYDLYLVEANHTRADIVARAEEKRARGEYAYEFKAAENHLSREQTEDWLYQNMGPRSLYAFLHGHEDLKGETTKCSTES